MTEFDELAQVIYEEEKAFWPITRQSAVALAWVYHPDESEQFLDNLADALMEIRHGRDL